MRILSRVYYPRRAWLIELYPETWDWFPLMHWVDNDCRHCQMPRIRS